MERLVLIKLGGSLITDKSKPFTAKEAVIRRLAREIKAAAKKYNGKIIIGHGSGSFGHTVAAKYQTQSGLINKDSVRGLSLVADAAIQINRIMMKEFLKENLPAFSFSPASFIISDKQKPVKVLTDQISWALKADLMPVVYGDVIVDKSMGCCIFSCEKTLNILAKSFRNDFAIDKIIHCGDTDGVYDENGKTIKEITLKSFNEYNKAIGKSGATDVTGGMFHKVSECLEIASSGINSFIISGRKPGNLTNAILGKQFVGTKVTE